MAASGSNFVGVVLERTSDVKANFLVRGDGLYHFAKAKAMLFHSHVCEIKQVGVISVYYRFMLHGRRSVLLKYLNHITVA